MDRSLETRITSIPDRLAEVTKAAGEIFDGISKWTSGGDVFSLRLLMPRLMRLLSNMEELDAEIDETGALIGDDKEREITRLALLQQKAILAREHELVRSLYDNICLSAEAAELSEGERIAAEITGKCASFAEQVRECAEEAGK